MSGARIPFLGSGWAFPPSFHAGHGTGMVSDEKDIRQSLGILLATAPGERVMQPTYGCDLRRLLFEPLDPSLRAYLQDIIKTAILYHEPRIKLMRVDLAEIPTEGIVEITVDYIVRATNSRFNFVFPFYRDQGSGVPK